MARLTINYGPSKLAGELVEQLAELRAIEYGGDDAPRY